MKPQLPRLVVMGVAGCGKSTLAQALAQALGAALIEGDEHHLPASQAKMRSGIALSDADRLPWLDRLGRLMAGHAAGVVLSCSALKRAYRARLRRQVAGLRFVFIDIDREQAQARVSARQGHEFPASLVDSQFATLQSPLGEAGVLRVAAGDGTAQQLEAVQQWLRGAPAAGPGHKA